ncbi:tigger transposable element-derived protein 1-like [Eleutherodactylus coqui]|uniref:tigger transposable element-derived protein 1-like n=1 Tax=Eleutherodactylus coqui TaxID=57060 RepID=UPI003462874C
MPPKRSAPSMASGSEPKWQRRMLTIKEKVELLDTLKEGKCDASVGHHYGIKESTVHYRKKDEKNIRTTAKMTFSKTAKRVVTSRNKAIVKMESALAVWRNDCRKKNISLDTNIIRTKAKTPYDRSAERTDVHDEEDEGDDAEAEPMSTSLTTPTPFSASKGWFDKFQRRFGLKSVPLHGENASANKAGAEECVSDVFKSIIEEGGYKPEQVFNMDEMVIFWKRIPVSHFCYEG